MRNLLLRCKSIHGAKREISQCRCPVAFGVKLGSAGCAPVAHRKEGRAYSLPPGPWRITSRICPDLISDRHRLDCAHQRRRWRGTVTFCTAISLATRRARRQERASEMRLVGYRCARFALGALPQADTAGPHPPSAKRYADGCVVSGTADPIAVGTRDFEEALEIRRFRCALAGRFCGTTDFA